MNCQLHKYVRPVTQLMRSDKLARINKLWKNLVGQHEGPDLLQICPGGPKGRRPRLTPAPAWA